MVPFWPFCSYGIIFLGHKHVVKSLALRTQYELSHLGIAPGFVEEANSYGKI